MHLATSKPFLLVSKTFRALIFDRCAFLFIMTELLNLSLLLCLQMLFVSIDTVHCYVSYLPECNAYVFFCAVTH
jgi:hypothetical protein